MSIGHVDVWFNGGQSQPKGIYAGNHKAAVFFFGRSITMTPVTVPPFGTCQYVASKCTDPKWSSFVWEKRSQRLNWDEKKSCNYGNVENTVRLPEKYF